LPKVSRFAEKINSIYKNQPTNYQFIFGLGLAQHQIEVEYDGKNLSKAQQIV
jgi:hypothetical protein